MSQPRLRIAAVIVTPVLFWDDDENLSPGPQAQAQHVSLADLAGLADKLRADVDRLNEQTEPPA